MNDAAATAKPSTSILATRRTNLTERQTNTFDRLAEMTIGYTSVVRGQVVTRWSEEMFEIGTHGRYSERIDEAAINLCS